MSSQTALYVTFVLFILDYANSQCSNLNTNQAACEADGYCIFSVQSHCVCGQTPWNQDIAFIFDSSMTAFQWTNSNQFASDLLYFASPSTTTTRTAILQTGDASTTSTVTLAFGDEPISHTMNSTLRNLTQSTQPSFYLQNALQNALQLFNTSSSSTHRKILIIFASQEFSQSPCKLNMRSHQIATYTIAMGDFNKYPLICVGSSENDYDGLITSVFNASDLWNILPQMEQILCPHHPLFKLTEIQLAGAEGQQYIEIYNYGHTIDDMSQLQITNIASGTLNSLSVRSWHQGTIAIIYNRDNDLPNCIHCACTESALTSSTDIKWCEDAIYIGCCANGCDCAFNTALVMTSFSISIIWINPQTLTRYTESVTFDTSHQWPIVGPNYALELQNRGYNNQFGSSWIMSCAIDGTPGDVYGSTSCDFNCAIDGADLCDLNSGMDTIQCKSASCNCVSGYYAHYHTCLPLAAPTDCIATTLTLFASNTAYQIAAWDGDTTYVYFHCERIAGCVDGFSYSQTATSLLNPIVFDQGRDTNSTLIALLAVDIDDNEWISDQSTCDHITQTPTLQPTSSPTYVVPNIPSCDVRLSSDLKTFDIVWTPIDMQAFGDNIPSNDTFLGYVYYYNNQRRSAATACCIIQGSTPGSLPFDSITPDQISVSGDWDLTLTDITLTDELLSATICNIMTQQPTITPTKSPTISPTLRPTINPTNIPTLSPTLEGLFIPACFAKVLSSSNTLNVSWMEANFGSNTASRSDTRYAVQWIYNDSNTVSDPWYVSANQDLRSTQVVVDNYSDILSLQMYCTWASFTQRGPITNCTLSTVSPTLSPTKAPSSQPTPSPLRIPSISPTNRPSLTPTKAPTFVWDDELIWCHAVFDIQLNQETVTLTWGLLTVNDTDPKIPPSQWITYIANIGDELYVIYAEHTTSEVCNTTHCWGQTQKILDDVSEISKVALRAQYEYNGDLLRRTNTIYCTVHTMSPTASPSVDPTLYPTLSPTFGDVAVYLENTACKDPRCGCSSHVISECCVSECDWNQYPAPVMIVSEKKKANTTFYVRRTEAIYPYAIAVEFNIYAVNETLAKTYGFYTRLESGDFSGDNQSTSSLSDIHVNYTIPTDCYFTDWDDTECEYYIDEESAELYPCANRYVEDIRDICSWCDFYGEAGPRCNDITPNSGTFVIPFSNVSTFEQSTFELSILSETEGCPSGCADFEGEVFLLELTNCEVILDGNNQSNDSRHLLDCNLIYPSRAFIIVTDQYQESQTDIIKIPDNSYDDWLWYVILGAVILLTATAYAGFTWWKNNKMVQSAAFADVEEEHAPVITEETSLIA